MSNIQNYDYLKMAQEIENYYYINTDAGRRERAMNLSLDYIALSNDFPYYDIGVRGIKKRDFYIDDELIENYTYYVDVYFLFTDIYLNNINNDSFYIDNIIIISNENNLSNMDICYTKFLSSDIDLSGFNYIISKNPDVESSMSYFTSHECLNILKSKVKYDLPFEYIEVEYIIENKDIKNINKVIKTFNTLTHKFIKNNKNIFIIFNLYLYMDYVDALKFLKMLMPKLNLNYSNVLLEVLLGVVGTYMNARKLKSKIGLDKYQDRLTHPEFMFLQEFRPLFMDIRVDVCNYIEI